MPTTAVLAKLRGPVPSPAAFKMLLEFQGSVQDGWDAHPARVACAPVPQEQESQGCPVIMFYEGSCL